MAAIPQYRRVWRDFLEAYMSMPCLWQVRCPDYGNREKRDECYFKLAEMCRQIEPKANKEFVLKKINCYRTTFRKELKKALDAQKKGVRYEPTLWYYRILLPVAEQQPLSSVKIEDQSSVHSPLMDIGMPYDVDTEMKFERQGFHGPSIPAPAPASVPACTLSTNTLSTSHFQPHRYDHDLLDQHDAHPHLAAPECESILTEHFGDEDDDDDDEEEDAFCPPPPAPPPPPRPTALKRPRRGEAVDFGGGAGPAARALDPAPAVPAAAPAAPVAAAAADPVEEQLVRGPMREDEFDYVGKNVAIKLRALARLAPLQSIVAEKLISDALFFAQLGALTRDAHLQPQGAAAAAAEAAAAGAGAGAGTGSSQGAGARSPRAAAAQPSAQPEVATSNSSHP